MKEPRFSQTTGQAHGQSRNRELTQYRELVNGRSLASVKFISSGNLVRLKDLVVHDGRQFGIPAIRSFPHMGDSRRQLV